MKRVFITFCIVWTALTILLIACSPLLRLYAAARSRADLERIKAGEPPLHATKVGQLISGVMAGRSIVYDRYKGFGYYINVFQLGQPLRGTTSQRIDATSFSGTITGPAFPLTIFDDSSTYAPSYDAPKKQP
jgi:hypothetical protein